MDSREAIKTRMIKGKPYGLCEIRAKYKGTVTTAWLELDANGGIWNWVSCRRYRQLERELVAYVDDALQYRIADIDNSAAWSYLNCI